MLRLPFVVSASTEWAGTLAASLSHMHIVNATQKRGRRRTTTPPIGVPPVWEKKRGERLDAYNRSLITRLAEVERQVTLEESNAQKELATSTAQTSRSALGEDQRRVGLVVRKLGMVPQWMEDGTRILCTLLEVPSNHIISVVSPEEWFRRSKVGKRKAFNRNGPWWKVTVGAGDAEAWRFTASYRAQFVRAGVPVKEHLGSFIVTEDALPEVGQPLDARHFSCGQYVTATGKSIDWGFQGGMHRWGMRGQPARRTTKSHRRIGSVGSVGDARIWPGKRMPGHMGWEWVTMSGIQIVRMNIDEQVIYVKGNVPGDIGEILLLKDCLQKQKRPIEICIPTWTPALETIEEEGGEAGDTAIEAVPAPSLTDRQVFIDKLFRFTSPSLLFTAGDAKKQAGRDKTKAKIAKVKK